MRRACRPGNCEGPVPCPTCAKVVIDGPEIEVAGAMSSFRLRKWRASRFPALLLTTKRLSIAATADVSVEAWAGPPKPAASLRQCSVKDLRPGPEEASRRR